MSTAIINAEQEKYTVEFTPPKKLTELLPGGKLLLELPCGGRGKCHKCKITARGELSPEGDGEMKLLSVAERESGIRFACLTYALGDVTLELAGRKNDLLIVMEHQLSVSGFEPLGKKFGAAVDVGTTTVAAYLFELSGGKLLAEAAAVNPQARFGADVISRLDFSLKGGRLELAETVRGCIEELIFRLCGESGTSASEIDAMVIVGNTAMLYLLCAADPSSICAVPFIQDRAFGERVTPAELSLPIAPDACVYLARTMSAYVGADMTAAVLSSKITEKKEVSLLVDIGTNGEMALFAGGRLLCCSTAAGPAFEGAGIHGGMTAGEGAVSRVKLEGGAFLVSVIGDVPAKGICGSGIIEALAAMLDAEILDETGVIEEDGHEFTAYIREFGGQPAFVLPGTEVLITQADVRAVQLAKSAICAGITSLLCEAGMTPEDVDALYIAGGFGSRIDCAAAERIGLIPRGFAKKARAIGNAAGAGASEMLLSKSALERSEDITKSAHTLELSTSKTFMDAYIDGMFF
ncbi:MAG: ASKHA domain-containing protein [Oscillospiraceae bacterium]|nr:ASKHA domain-containing protein [Oscillospiraceae bacterium]